MRNGRQGEAAGQQEPDNPETFPVLDRHTNISFWGQDFRVRDDILLYDRCGGGIVKTKFSGVPPMLTDEQRAEVADLFLDEVLNYSTRLYSTESVMKWATNEDEFLTLERILVHEIGAVETLSKQQIMEWFRDYAWGAFEKYGEWLHEEWQRLQSVSNVAGERTLARKKLDAHAELSEEFEPVEVA